MQEKDYIGGENTNSWNTEIRNYIFFYLNFSINYCRHKLSKLQHNNIVFILLSWYNILKLFVTWYIYIYIYGCFRLFFIYACHNDAKAIISSHTFMYYLFIWP